MDNLTIRRYRRSDLNEVKNLHAIALKAIDAYIDSGNWDSDLDNIEKVYLNNKGEFLVGLIDEKIAAMGALKKITDKICELKRMRVHPEFQRRGYGQVMLNTLETKAKKLGYKVIQLDTTVKQVAAQNLYLKNGYKEVGRKIKGPPHETIYYRKELL